MTQIVIDPIAPKLLTITGPSGSGKTTLLNKLVTGYGWRPAISHTTRPMRAGEVNHVDYHFITLEEFNYHLDEDDFVESVEFNGNKYGVAKGELEPLHDMDHMAIIVEPHGLAQIQKYMGRDNVFSLYLHASDQTLVKRYLSRMVAVDLTSDKALDYHAGRLLSIPTESSIWSDTDMYDLRLAQELPEQIDLAATLIESVLRIE